MHTSIPNKIVELDETCPFHGMLSQPCMLCMYHYFTYSIGIMVQGDVHSCTVVIFVYLFGLLLLYSVVFRFVFVPLCVWPSRAAAPASASSAWCCRGCRLGGCFMHRKRYAAAGEKGQRDEPTRQHETHHATHIYKYIRIQTQINDIKTTNTYKFHPSFHLHVYTLTPYLFSTLADLCSLLFACFAFLPLLRCWSFFLPSPIHYKSGTIKRYLTIFLYLHTSTRTNHQVKKYTNGEKRNERTSQTGWAEMQLPLHHVDECLNIHLIMHLMCPLLLSS